ncbi:hypothetical protein [Polaromonas sp. CG9_12]|nr:hypothetical protein [Polaromonas sp. CG9_12]
MIYCAQPWGLVKADVKFLKSSYIRPYITLEMEKPATF